MTIAATLPGEPATGIRNGSPRVAICARSRMPAPVRRIACRGPRAATEATPSVNGAVAITAAIVGSPAATVITWPPDIDGPQMATLPPSTSSRARTYSSAASQSARCRPNEMSCRGSPSLPSRCR